MFGIFKKKSKKLSQAIDLSALKTDMHSHLIAGVDDGSKSLEESVALVKGLAELGYNKLYTTPHIQQDKFRNTPEIITGGLSDLKAELNKEDVHIRMEAAAEYLIDDGFREKMESGKLMTIGDNYVLVELSYFTEPFGLKNTFFELQTNGYKVILAHPERYTYWHNSFEVYEELYNRNIYLQLNINSLTGWYSEQSMKVAQKLIDHKLIRFLGSDLHNEVYLKQLQMSLYEPYLDKVLSSGKIMNHKL
jgi:tyrosine-protein phosphatase YwqE